MRPPFHLREARRMRIIDGPGGPCLEHQGRLVRLDQRDRILLSRMTPMGRKVYIGRKGKFLRADRKDDSDAELLLSWSRMPARDWSFPVPE